MDDRRPEIFASVESCVERTLARVGKNVVLCAPIALGKPVALVNEFYRRAAADPALSLSILTGLTLKRPRGRSELERRLVEPMAERVFGGMPEPAWIAPLAASALPPNVRVQEFFFEPGAWLGSAQAQQSYASINYTHVARTVAAAGANVLAQQVAWRPDRDGGRISVASNPDVTVDLLPMLEVRRAAGLPVAIVGQVNDRMPYLFGPADMPAAAFDFVVDDPRAYHDLFSPPNLPIATADHAIALAASMLVRDGGTVQIGIGELGDAIVHALILRHRENAAWRQALADTGFGPRFAAERAALGGEGAFEQGLYGVTEMFVDGFLDLYRAGILRRRAADGAVLHGAFLLGPRAFYEELRAMPDAERALFRMAPVSFTNELGGADLERKVAERRDARFINTAMMATAGGALVSDGLADGRVVSGVGGQYNFVAQAHELPGGRSLIAVRATRGSGGRVESNIRFNYGHVTIPRHLRDVVLTEYGVADLRGLADAEVGARMLQITDSRFQENLRSELVRAGKLPASHRIGDAHRRNYPEALERSLAVQRTAGRFQELPFGTDLTEAELRLARSLRALKSRAGSWPGRTSIALSLLKPPARDAATEACLSRMGLSKPRGLRERILRRLVASALNQ